VLCSEKYHVLNHVDDPPGRNNVKQPSDKIIVSENNSSTPTKLTIMVWNIQGLGTKLLDKDFLLNISQYDVVILLETMKLDSYKPNAGTHIFKHYQRKYQHPRARKPSGGIGILIREDLYSGGIVTVAKASDFAIWLKIKQSKNNDVTHLGGVYVPPLDSTSTMSSFQNNNAFHIIQEDITHFKQLGNVTVCGDFNARTGDLSDFLFTHGKDNSNTRFAQSPVSQINFPNINRFSEDSKTNRYGRELIDLCKSSDMRIMNGFFRNDKNTGVFTCYTPCGKSLIDYLICDHCCFESLQSFEIVPLNTYSDHRSLVFALKLLKPSVARNSLERINSGSNTRDKFFRYIFDTNLLPGIAQHLTSVGSRLLYDSIDESVTSDKGVNDAVDNLYTLLESAISQICPKKFQRSITNTFPKNEWYDEECKNLKRVINAFVKTHDLNLDANLKRYHELKGVYKAMTQRKKRQYQSKIRDELCNRNNSQDYWKYWNKISTDTAYSVSTNGISLETFETYFNSIQSPPDNAFANFDMEFLNKIEEYLRCYEDSSLIDLTLIDQPITLCEVQESLDRLKLGKAPGVDGICNEFYKYLSSHLSKPLTLVFNYIWKQGIYPDKWSEGIIQPLFKKGNINDVDNYRKVTLMACMGKIFESIITKRLTLHTEVMEKEDPYQFGFTKECRTCDNVFIIDTLISHQKSVKKNLYIAFIDFSKAFDYINRTFLYYKMLQKGLSGRLLKIIQSMFSNASAKVRWKGELGSNIDSIFGVLQGGIVSPKLFNLYLSDLSEYLDETCGVSIGGTTYTHLLYADDLVLISENSKELQTLLDNLENYCKKWHLIINLQKSKVMRFDHAKKKSGTNNFRMQDEILEEVNSYKYLGHVISNSTNPHKTMYEHLAVQAQKATHSLKDKIKNAVGYLTPKLSLKMFDTHILPILEYNSAIWFPLKEINDLEKIQLKFLKNMLSVRYQTSTVAVLADTGRFPLIVRQQTSAIKYLQRLISSTCPLLLQNCYKIQKQLHDKKFPCWLNRLHKAVNELGLTINFSRPSLTANAMFEKTQNKMLSEINDSLKNPKLRTYRHFKLEFRIEPYLNSNFSKAVYSSIARLRLGSHNLNIELGRHKRPLVPAEERICEKCDLNEIEDEFHCVMVCKKWTDLRQNLIMTAHNSIEGFLVLNQFEQFCRILNSKKNHINYALGKFLQEALKIAKSANN